MSLISLKNICKSFTNSEEKQCVLLNLNIDILEGQSIALTGESGAGKSTLLNIIAGLEPPTSGDVIFDGKNIWSESEDQRSNIRKNKISLIFQQFNLIPSLNVIQNIEFHAKLINKYDNETVIKVINKLGLTNILEHFPEQISGGQQQRAAIARAIVAKPKLILADEPTGNLDENSTKKVISMIHELLQKSKTTLVVATHSTELAQSLQKTVQLKSGTLSTK